MKIFLLFLTAVSCWAQTRVDYPTQVKRPPIGAAATLPGSCTITGNLFTLTTTGELYICIAGVYVIATASPVPYKYAPSTTSVPRTMGSKLNESVSVQDFGAKGDGAANDTAAIAAAIAAARLNGQGVYFPPGAGCYMTDTITDLRGDDHWYGPSTQDKSCIQSRSGASVIDAWGTEIDRVEIDHLKIVGTGTGTGRGIGIRTSSASSSIDIHDIRFDAVGGTCLFIPNSFSINVWQIEAKCGKGGSGNGIDIDASNTGHVHDSYIYDVGANSTSKGTVGGQFNDGTVQTGMGAAYRFHSGYLLCTNCNGINNGPNWGIFGDNMAEDGVTAYARISLINPNVEGFTATGIRTKNFSCLASIIGGKTEGTTGTLKGILSDATPGCSGVFLNHIVTLDGAGTWSNGQAIHFTGDPPFTNYGGGLSGASTNVLQAWDDGNAHVVNIPYSKLKGEGNYVYSTLLDHADLPFVHKFCLGGANSTIAPICQNYGQAAPTYPAPHALGEIVWNDRSGADTLSIGFVCTAAGSPGTWLAFGAPPTIPTIPSVDYKIIASGTNGCASPTCWQIDGVLGPATLAATSQGGLYAPAPTGAGVFVRQIVLKSVTACTGATTIGTGVYSAGDYAYIVAAPYDLMAAVSDTNMFQTMTNVGAGSDGNTTLGPVVATTGGNVSDIAAGCEFKMWIDSFTRAN